MNIVKKYGLSRKREIQQLGLPEKARVLSVVVQQEDLYVFVEEDANASIHNDHSQEVEFAIFKDCRVFAVDDYQFLGTVVLEFGNSIYHVFYRNV